MDIDEREHLNPATRFYKEFINKLKNIPPGKAMKLAKPIVRQNFIDLDIDRTKWDERINFNPSNLVNVTRFEAYRFIVMNWLMYRKDEECPKVPSELLI